MTSESGYINGNSGSLFCTVSSAEKPRLANIDHTVLIIPPFLEEMNRSRRLMACIRREIARQGASALLVDLFGTGDSSGDLADVCWHDWTADTRSVVEQLFAANASAVSLIGIRSGCLLANDLFTHFTTRKFRNVVYIAPEKSGKKVLRQWMRTSIVKQRLAEIDVGSATELWHKIGEGADLNYAGYRITSSLSSGLRAVELLDNFPPCTSACKLAFISQLNAEEKPCVDANGWENHNIYSQRFWMQEEYEVDSELVLKIAGLASR